MNVNSVTKGIMALLAGIALDKGYIKDVDQKVMDFFPDYTVKRGEKTIYDVTIRHLLTMTAPYKGKSEPWKKVCTSQDFTLAILDYLGGRKVDSPVSSGTLLLVSRSLQVLLKELQERSASISPTGSSLPHWDFLSGFLTETVPRKISLISS